MITAVRAAEGIVEPLAWELLGQWGAAEFLCTVV